ncbi:hypothetical protein ACXIZN_41075 [Amycolatopsis sp. TRM77291]
MSRPNDSGRNWMHDARANGCTWREIGHALGASPDDAHVRFDPGTPIADRRWPYEH